MPNNEDICKNHCPGLYYDKKGSCCIVGDREWILGPIEDAKETLQNLQEINPCLSYSDVFIDYEEGSKMYPEKESWQFEDSYPALRLVEGACLFFSKEKGCTVYEKRPLVCRQWTCPPLRKSLGIPEFNQFDDFGQLIIAVG